MFQAYRGQATPHSPSAPPVSRDSARGDVAYTLIGETVTSGSLRTNNHRITRRTEGLERGGVDLTQLGEDELLAVGVQRPQAPRQNDGARRLTPEQSTTAMSLPAA